MSQPTINHPARQFVVFMIPWLTRLNDSLILFDPIMIVPLVQSNFIVWAIIGGGIFFQVAPA